LKIIEVTVSPKGETKIETKGFAGSACKAASESLEKALGLKQSEKLTAEFYSQQTQKQQLKEGT
jgi:hypothetical protein